MKPWQHQERGLDELDDLIQQGRKRICFCSPTGGGKTLMAIIHMMRHGLPTAFYTHRRSLLHQTGRRFEEAGIEVGYRAADMPKSLLNDVQLAMIQSEHPAVFTRKSRELHRAKIIYIDECHANKQKQTMDIIEGHGEDCVVVGLTATPLDIGHIYHDLVIAGTNSELRSCGPPPAHVVCETYAPDEPDTNLVGKVKIGEGECGINQRRRMQYVQRVFSNVIENLHILNPELKPTLLFAPGVKESVWFAGELCAQGIPAAHIDGETCWLDGDFVPTSEEVREEIRDRLESGDLKVVCNRFVLREGVDWPFIAHGIFATVFGSLTSFLQAGGRLIRNHASIEKVTLQDHGGNWWRHGSLNSDRIWKLIYTDRICASLRMELIREGKELEPIHCPKCNKIRLSGNSCPFCGHINGSKTRPVLQANGSLKQMRNPTFKPRRRLAKTQSIEKEWIGRIVGIKKSKKPHVQQMTFSQVQANFAREHNWQYPPLDLPMMPTNTVDWFRPVVEVERLTS